MEKSNIKKSNLVYYSLLAIPLAILGLPLYIYLPTFYATDIKVDMVTIGIILFLARALDVLIDPFIGYLSDKINTKFKTRKPLILFGSLILLFSFYMLINPQESNAEIYLFVFSTLVYFAWSFVYIPYLTWSAEISEDYHEKTKLNSAREMGTIIGILLALTLPYLFSISQDTKKVLDLLFILFLFTYICFVSISLIKIKVKGETKSDKINMEKIKNIYKKIPKLKHLQFGYFLNNLANAIPATLFLLFVELVLKEKASTGLLLLIYFLSGVLALPFWTILAKKTTKKKVWIYSILLACLAFIFVPFLNENHFRYFVIICIVSGLSLGADLAFPTSIHSDLVQNIQKIQNNSSGLLFGFWSMITKLSLALSVAISFGILGLIGFNEENPNEFSLVILSLLYGLMPVLLKLLAIIFINKYKESTKIMN